MSAPLPDPAASPRATLLWLMVLRVVVVTVLLGSAVLVELTAPGSLPTDSFFVLIGLTYALTAIYAVLLRYVDRHRWIIDLQMAGDAVTVSALVQVTGGITSYFSSLYALPIISASILQFRRGSMLLATLSMLLFGSLVVAQYSAPGLVPGADLPPVKVAFYRVGINVFGFFAVAFLSGYLTENLRRAGARLERASHEIADLQAFSQHVIDSLTSGVVTGDYEGRILTFSRAAEAITGHHAASVVGRRVDEVLQFPLEVKALFERDLSDACGRRLEFRYATSGGRAIDLGLSATHLITPGGRAGLLFAFQDVTEIKKLERDARIQQRLAAVGEMAAAIAHEIRNPLASISGSVQLLRHELPLTEDQAQLLDIVLRESDRLNNTIRSFLAYARPQRFAVSRLDLRGVISDAALLLRNSSEVGNHHVVDVELPPTEVWYEADEGQIRQIVWNLATNGLRAMPSGGRLRISAAVEPDSGGASTGGVILTVTDEGVGIPPDELDSIFQPFHGRFERGSGLGLSIVHRIVSDYDGEIQVTSAPGSGTAVRIRFPAQLVASYA